MDRQFRLNVSIYQKQEEHLGEKLSLAEIEEVMSQLGEIDSIDVQDGNQGPVYHVEYDDKVIAVGLPFMQTKIESSKSEIKDVLNVLSEIVDISTEKTDEIEYHGEISIIGEIKKEEKLFEGIEPPVSDYKQVSALAFSKMFNDHRYGISVNESDGEKLNLNISFPFKTVSEDEGSITIEAVSEDIFELFNQIEEELGEN